MNAALPRLGLIVALASLAACKTVGPDYALPEGSAFKRPQANAAFIDTQNPQIAANQALPDRWWSLYNDPVLDGLITQALRDNVELKAADAHLRRAAAVYEQALDAGGFEYEAEAGVSRAQLSAESFLQEHELPVINLADGKFAVSYQFDLFGKLKRGAEAARADEQSVAAARDLAQVSVVAQVADSYLEICHANHELHVAEHSLQRHPDVRQAERKLASATARIGVATAELYPDIRLGASLGAAGLLEDFGTPMTQQWSIGPLISWTLPSSGTHARIHAAEAGADAALAEFDHTVLQALRETQTALDRYAQDLRRLQSLRVAQEQAALAAEQNRRLYQGGRTPYLSSLDADRSLASSDATLAAAEAQVSRDQIHLFLVLGGGWQASVAPAAPSTAQATAK